MAEVSAAYLNYQKRNKDMRSFLLNYELWLIVAAVIVGIISFIHFKNEEKKYAAIITLLTINSTLLISIRYILFPVIESKGIISQELFKDDQTLDLANNIIYANQRIENLNNIAFSDFYSKRKKEIKDFFSMINNGSLVVSKEEIGKFSIDLIKTAKKELVATSYVNNSEWWNTDWGRQYEELNYTLVKNGVRIERFFIFSNKQDYEKSKDLINRQKSKGIKVHYLFISQIMGNYNQDVILIDNKIGGKLILNPDKGMVRAEMIILEENLFEIKNIIENLRLLAIKE